MRFASLIVFSFWVGALCGGQPPADSPPTDPPASDQPPDGEAPGGIVSCYLYAGPVPCASIPQMGPSACVKDHAFQRCATGQILQKASLDDLPDFYDGYKPATGASAQNESQDGQPTLRFDRLEQFTCQEFYVCIWGVEEGDSTNTEKCFSYGPYDYPNFRGVFVSDSRCKPFKYTGPKSGGGIPENPIPQPQPQPQPPEQDLPWAGDPGPLPGEPDVQTGYGNDPADDYEAQMAAEQAAYEAEMAAYEAELAAEQAAYEAEMAAQQAAYEAEMAAQQRGYGP